MTAGWKTKMPIYDLVKTLAWNSSQEMTDRIWGRFAWIVRILLTSLLYSDESINVLQQLALADYNAAKAPAEGFWDIIDVKLAEHREKTAEIPLEQRAAYESMYVLLPSYNSSY
jgi:hypothetical protein